MHIKAYRTPPRKEEGCIFIRGENLHDSKRGETCYFDIVYVLLSCSDHFSLILSHTTCSHYPMLDLGGRGSLILGEKNLWYLLQIPYSFGDMPLPK